MRIWIPRLFRQAGQDAASPAGAERPAGAAREVEETLDPGVSVTYMTSRVPEVESAFGYGHLDGRRQVAPENFREFIQATVEGEGLERRRAGLETRERKLDAIRAQRAEAARQAEELRGQEARATEVSASLTAAQASLREAEQAEETHRGAGSLIQAAVFVLAGLLFILGDVVMAREIVADALEMVGWEAWAFAVGLAMISVVLKPAYDRLVEKPFGQGNARRFAYVICVLAVFSFGTLFVLGGFRSESHANTTRIGLIQSNPDLTPTARATELADLQRAMLESSWGHWSFILSGILFAAAGAVSLSVGFSYGRDYRYVRRPAILEARRRRKRIAALGQERERAIAEAARVRRELEETTARLSDAPPPAELQRQLQALEAERQALEAEVVAARARRLRSLYDDGYELGTALGRESAANEARTLASEERPRRKKPRPFVAVRRAIREARLNPNLLN